MAGGRRFSYYERLSASDKAIYRKSDEIARIALPDPTSLAPLAKALELALFSGKRLAVAQASNALADAMLDQLAAPRVKITVRETRPELGEGAELHGLYTFADEEEETPAKIELWMRTRAQEKVVRFRTFLRTMLHEVCHHLDMTLLDLGDSFHTEGFFRRESSLVRQLFGESARKRPAVAREEPAAETPAAPKQMKLF
jgi:hypothetical protein